MPSASASKPFLCSLPLGSFSCACHLAPARRFRLYSHFNCSYYPIAHWIWGTDGWLYNMGAQDFAGGIVIHVTSAVSGLVVCRALGSRRGFDPQGESFPHSNLVLSAIGLGMLWVGWYGFNAGSAFAAGAQASEAIMNTHASACCSALAWLYLSQRGGSATGGKPSFIAVANGSVAGLAAITPAAGACPPCSCAFLTLFRFFGFEHPVIATRRLRRRWLCHSHWSHSGLPVVLELPRHQSAPAHRRRS